MDDEQKVYPALVDLRTMRYVEVGDPCDASDHEAIEREMAKLNKAARNPAAKTVVKVTEGVGALTFDYDMVGFKDEGERTKWQPVWTTFRAIVPPGISGKRGRFKVTVEFTPEDDE